MDPSTGIRSFKGMPFAEPPVGDLRWREPQPVKNWAGIRPAHVPLLVGWNSAESGYQAILGKDEPTVANFTNALRRLYGDGAGNALRAYAAAISTPDDYKVSETMQGFFANFVKSGNPNGPGLPDWPAAAPGQTVQIMHLDVNPRAEPDRHRDRYRFLDQFYAPDR